MTTRSFDSLDQVFTDLDQLTDRALEAATPAQRAIDYGDHWMRYVKPLRLWIFGRVATLDEQEASVRATGVGEEEVAISRASAVETHRRGFRFGPTYSERVPDGEIGSTHIVTIGCTLTAEQFETLRGVGWQLPRLLIGPDPMDTGHRPPEWLVDAMVACTVQCATGWA
jgi:hypothetical protein